ncbi:hypothetical protein [Stakelama pacifica]|uniref:Uncharacterized protein n=1 Tax=Stakelama pacifica TaxID=517720 RepID=A0A4R6FL72_9SPHN|nr:hypothetical protein [Stakelama pacifica]MAW98573.1 hypothetical protein [Sphingomonas sp.]TDN82213.1 hypothetical protein EV664_10619 [Stakelama pacifica]GGO95953.1 hypothetical protein GCM10011329_21360 [Stakelama pacifica]
MHQFRDQSLPGRTGYRISYRMHEVNHCPGCGNTHWIVGRSVAECAFCETALPLNEGGSIGTGLVRGTRRTQPAPLAA